MRWNKDGSPDRRTAAGRRVAREIAEERREERYREARFTYYFVIANIVFWGVLIVFGVTVDLILEYGSGPVYDWAVQLEDSTREFLGITEAEAKLFGL